MEEVIEAVRRGRKWREEDAVHASIRNIEVVYKMVDSTIFVITVHYR